MASGRMLRAQISLSPQVNDLSIKAALLFTWLIPHVDDFGRIHADPRRIKATIVPMRDDISAKEIPSLLNEIEDKSLIVLYRVDGDFYLQLTKFEKHQQGLHKRTISKLPAPEAANLLDSGKFREIPKNSHPTEQEQNRNRTEQEQNLKALSGKPDDASFQKKSEINKKIKKEAIEILEFLNLKAGKKFRQTDVNLKMIEARLNSGASVEECKKIIIRKTREWINDSAWKKYLRPATLFNLTKFEQYIGELVVVEEN